MSVFHIYSDYDPKDGATKLRQKVAQMTWSTQLWTNIPIHDSDLPRLWEEEGKKFPYLHDLFDFACRGDSGQSIIIYTNADICVRSDCAVLVASIMQDIDAFYSYRRDFNQDFSEPVPDDVIPRGDDYCGSDFYAFRVRWWRNHKKEFPDLLIGTEAWDPILRHLMEFTQPGKHVNIPNTNYHRKHFALTNDPVNRYRLKRQIYNLRLAALWLREHGINPSVHGIKNL